MNILGWIKERAGKSSKFIVLLICLSLWGCLAIYNSTFFSHTPFLSSGKQVIWLAASALLMMVCAAIPAQHYFKLNLIISPLLLISLWGVLLYGIKVNGMRGWFDLGPIYLQPSELSKPFYVLTLCSIIQRRQQDKCLKNDMLYFGTALLWLLPIMFQPDYGTLTVYCGGLILIYWCMGGSLKTVLKAGTALVTAAITIVLTRPYVWNRIKAFISPESDPYNSGWHILQYRKALAHGGLWGSSWGHSNYTEMYLPNPQHDSIFASLGEAIGFTGLLPVFLTILVLLYFCFIRTWQINDRRYSSVIYGIISTLAFQALLHISVTVGIFPPTGITLPLLSYGGSSLAATMISFGIIISFINVATNE